MALRKNIELETGIKVNDAYLRVEIPSLTKDTLSFVVRKYADIDKPYFKETFYNTSYDINGTNPFKQAYEYLKTLEEFKESKDS